jgi:hypothetical protein
MNSTVLAEATAIEIGTAAIVIVFLMGALLLGTKLKEAWFKNRPDPTEMNVSPNPFPVQITEKFATKEELHEIKVEMRELEKALPETERRILRAIDESGAKIGRTVNRMAEVATEGRRTLHEKARLQSIATAALENDVRRTNQELREFKSQFRS